MKIKWGGGNSDEVIPSSEVPSAGGTRHSVVSLKTNLLFDALLVPNLSAEFPIGRRWSVVGECWFPWWKSRDDSRALQILFVGAEGRYWLGNRQLHDPLRGHFVGLFAGGGKYDLENHSKGYQGEFYIAAGLSYGYVFRLNRRLGLELSVGIGYLRTQYRHYVGAEDNRYLVWQNDGTYTWVGPVKANVSLVWDLPFLYRKGGRP